MNFLFPLYLLGAAAVLIPLWLHLRRKPPQQVAQFSSLMFLEATPVPPIRKRRLDDLLLLLLRCLAILLLAMLFSRPLWKSQPSVATIGNAWVILLDRSASMQREDLALQVQQQLDAALAVVEEHDEVALVGFDREPGIILSQEAWAALPEGSRKAALKQQASEVKPGWQQTDLGRALTFAAGVLSANTGRAESVPFGRARTILLISDMQEGTSLQALGSYAWPSEVAVRLLPVKSAISDNLTLAPAPRTTDSTSMGDDVWRVRVMSQGGAKTEKYTLAWEGTNATPQEGEILPGSVQVQTAPLLPTGMLTGTLELKGDRATFDNRVWYAPSAPQSLRLLVVNDAQPETKQGSVGFFLERALQSNSTLQPQIIPKTWQELSLEDLTSADLVFAFGRGTAEKASLLREWITGGKTVLWVLTAPTDPVAIETLTGWKSVSLSEAVGSYAMLGQLQYTHPLLKPFVETTTRDFSKIRFWKHRVLKYEPIEGKPVSVIAAFDDGHPAWLETTLGAGRLIVATSSWTVEESQFALSSKFVPWLYALFDLSGVVSLQETVRFTGDGIALPAVLQKEALKIALPDGSLREWNGATHPSYTATEVPGIYTFSVGTETRSYAVNMSPEEGRIKPMDLERLQEFGVRLIQESALDQPILALEGDSLETLADTQLEEKQKLWKPIALALLGLLFVETLVAALRENRPSSGSLDTATTSNPSTV